MTDDRSGKLEEEADALLAGLNAPATEAEGSTPPQPTGDTPAEPATEVAVESADAAPVTETAADAPEAQTEEMVPLSRYKNAEKLMHQKAQEAADLRRRNAQLEAELQQARAAAPETQDATSGDDDPELREFQEFYPEIAKPVAKQLKALQEQVERANARFAQLDESEQQAVQRAHWEAITTAHPDAAQIAADAQFQAWVAEQPPIFQMAVAQGSAQDVNHVLSTYKASQHSAPASPSQPASKLAQARQAAGPSVGRMLGQTHTQRVFTRDQIRTMSQSEYDANEAEIDRQMAAGLIV
jgi:transcription termination factor NusB